MIRKVETINCNLRHSEIEAVLMERMIEEDSWKGKQRKNYKKQIITA